MPVVGFTEAREGFRALLDRVEVGTDGMGMVQCKDGSES